jgi:cysteine-rich repeat protein
VGGILLAGLPAQGGIPGDVTGDGAVNVADIQCTVLAAMSGKVPACLGAAGADLNCDDVTDIVDVQTEVLIVLYHPKNGLPVEKDANGNNIHDDCESGPVEQCGDAFCTGTETCTTCEVDCGPCGQYVACDFVITEIMKDPKAVEDVYGEWFEIRNMKGQTVDLNGWTIKDSATDSHKISKSVVTTAGQVVVLGRSANKAVNGGITVNYEYTGFTLGDASDAVILLAPDGTLIDQVVYGAGFPSVSGYSMSLDAGTLNCLANDTATNWCPSSVVIPGGTGDWGSPGIMNANCPKNVCGNNKIEVPETCEPPNTPTCDGNCQTISQDNVCGNNVLEVTEECDDGCAKGTPGICEPVVDDGDGCTFQCKKETAVCGNNKKEGTEECDDGNTLSGDGCSSTCKSEAHVCGNSIVEPPWEECDPPGNLNPKGEKCNADCSLGGGDPFCGDAVVQGAEQCDDGCMKGVPNLCEDPIDNGDGCNASCGFEGVIVECGNGKVEPINDETCDPPGKPNPKGEWCNEWCKLETPPCCNPSPCCCDGVKDAGEECDDGNKLDGDTCDPNCKLITPPVTQGISGTITYAGGQAKPVDQLRIMYYKAKPASCKEGGAPAGGDEKKGITFPYDYKLAVTPTGTYYVSAVLDIGGNSPNAMGDEDTCFLYANGVVVQANKITTNINMLLPPGGVPADTGTIMGTITFTGAAGANDSIRVMASTTKPPQVNIVGAEYHVKGVTYPHAYELKGIKVGQIYVLGKFDKNDDSPQQPGAGDYIGGYKSASNPVTVTVTKDQTTSNINFALDTQP